MNMNRKQKTMVENMYNDYVGKHGPHMDGHGFDRYQVFEKVVKIFEIEKAVYAGSYIHITPSFLIPQVIYIDTVKKAKVFFDNKEDVLDLIDKHKVYDKESVVEFIPKDYWSSLDIEKGYADLLISQYAGFVSQACKKYLKSGGILLANDSHGDATLAYFDKDYEFIGVLIINEKAWTFKQDDLTDYFTFKRKRPVDLEKVKETMKGPTYKKMPEYYIFKRQ